MKMKFFKKNILCCKAPPNQVDLMEIFPLTAVSKSRLYFFSIVIHLSCTSLQYLLCGDCHYKLNVRLLCEKKNATNHTFKKKFNVHHKNDHIVECFTTINTSCPLISWSWNTYYRSDARVTDDHLLTGLQRKQMKNLSL